MGLLMRPRRPIARMAAGAATAGIAYHAGKSHGQSEPEQQPAAAPAAAAPAPAPAAPAPAAPAPAPAPAGGGGTAEELSRLTQLHDQGALTDEEFAAAKRKAIGA